jgi:putative heme-binding domain-containing protein
MIRTFIGLTLFAAISAAQDTHNPLAGQTAAIEAGQKRFRESCAACHGANAEGGRGPNLAENEDLKRMSDDRLFNTIRHGIPGSDMPATPMPDQQTWEVAAFVRSLSTPAFATPVQGNVDAGRALFFGKAGCSGCHMIRGNGGFLGPDLTNAGAIWTVAQLRNGVLHPDLNRMPGFMGVQVVTKQGRRIDGVAKGYSNYSVQILDAQGRLHLLNRSELEHIELREHSLMPGDYGRTLTPEELQNVIAFVGKQVIRPDAQIPTHRRDEN